MHSRTNGRSCWANTLIEAVILVFIVMYVFLQNMRYTLIPTLVVPVALRVSAGGFELLGAGVGEVQLDVVARENAGEFEADVADPEDRDGRNHRQRLEQEDHLASAALAPVLIAGLVVQSQGERLGRGDRVPQ